MKRIKSFLAIALIVSTMLTGCTKPLEQTDTGSTNTADNTSAIERLKNGDEVIISMKEHSTGFDPCTGWGQYGNPLIQSKLFKVDEQNKIAMDLATEYNVSDDGLVWTVKVRDDVKFHDGSMLTAKDVAFTYNNTKELASKIDLTMLKNAEAVDDTTVKFHMEKPWFSFLYTMGVLAIVPEATYKDSATYSNNPIGSGPYKFVQFDQGQQLILERNDDYYGKKPAFKKLTFVMMTTDAGFAAAKSGAVDVALTNEGLAQNPIEGYNVAALDTYDYRVISMPVSPSGEKTDTGNPMGNDVTSDVAIRKALYMGISRNEMINSVLYGYGEPTFDVYSKFPWGIKAEAEKLTDGNPEEAKKVLDDAGWVEKDGIRYKGDLKAEFTLMYATGDVTRQSIAEAFAVEAKKLGININLESLDWSEIEPRVKTDSVVLGGGAYSSMEIQRLFDSSKAKVHGYTNVSGFNDSKVDEEINLAISSVNEEQANIHWQNALRRAEIGEESATPYAYIPICYVKHIYFVRDGLNIGNQVPHPHNHGLAVTANIDEWKFE